MSKWIDCQDGKHPQPGFINSFHDTMHVIAYGPKSGVVSCIFEWVGGDACSSDKTPRHSYHTDEGLGYSDITHWMPLPGPPGLKHTAKNFFSDNLPFFIYIFLLSTVFFVLLFVLPYLLKPRDVFFHNEEEKIVCYQDSLYRLVPVNQDRSLKNEDSTE